MTSRTPFPNPSGGTPSALATVVEQMSDRGLGDLEVRSHLLHVTENLTLRRAADNLLGKAALAIASGDRPRAERYVDRALELPFDELAEGAASLESAHMSVHRSIANAVETSPEGNSGWLDAAEAALPRCGVHAREDLLETLRAVANDYQLDRDEVRRIHRIAPGDGPANGIGDIMLTRTGADRATVRELVFELLDALVLLEQEFVARE